MAEKSLGEETIPFGLHKGKKFDEIPANYLLHIHSLGWVHGKTKDYIEQNLESLKKEAEELKNKTIEKTS